MKILFTLLSFVIFCMQETFSQQPVPVKPRVLISTDIGGTDPDDNQSMAHLLMYNDAFHLEGLISSPSYGNGSKEAILKMIDLYEKDYPKLLSHNPSFLTPDQLRSLCKQGRKGQASFQGYDQSTEGSDWIITCARKNSTQPLWILIWGGLEDLAQALHDAPDIQSNIRVYWIGGPNKKWSVNSYVYIAENFPDLWIIEANASYRGFIASNKGPQKYNNQYYDSCIRHAGHLGEDFINYYGGRIKMGDTPSLLYMMDGDPSNPAKECWGGSFEPMSYSTRTIYERNTTEKDTIPVYSIFELHLKGPRLELPAYSACFKINIDKQEWDGYYLGDGIYGVRYAPKAPGKLTYIITSDINELNGQKGTIIVGSVWPGKANKESYKLGKHWFTDKQDPTLFEGSWQGARTVSKWRNEVLADWEKRWNWLK